MWVLVIGASGFLGTKLVEVLAKDFQILGTYCSHKVSDLYFLDITNLQQTKKIVKKVNPEVIICTAGLTDIDYCELNKKEAFNVNVIGIRNLIDAIDEKTKLVYISSNYVFDGRKGNYTEYEKKNPINYYGTTKSVAEELVKKHGNYLIIRTGHIYGYAQQSQNFLMWVYENLTKQSEIHVVQDQVTNPTLVDDIAHIIKKLLNQKKRGILHVMGSEIISLYEFAYKTAKTFSLDNTLIYPIQSEKLFISAKRPLNIYLSISKLHKYGMNTNTVTQGLSIIKKQFMT